MKMIKVGLREFRMKMKKYISSGKKIVLTSNGQEIGVYIPRFRHIENKKFEVERG